MNTRTRFWLLENIVWPVQDVYETVRYGSGAYVAVVEVLKYWQRSPIVPDLPVTTRESIALLTSPTVPYRWLAKAMTAVCVAGLRVRGYHVVTRIVDPLRAHVLEQGYATFRQLQIEKAELAAEQKAA